LATVNANRHYVHNSQKRKYKIKVSTNIQLTTTHSYSTSGEPYSCATCTISTIFSCVLWTEINKVND